MDATSTAVIITEELTRSFGAHIAVNNLTLRIEAGEVFGFLGHNGAGKTTTVRLLNGVLAPTSGSVRVFGLDPTTAGHRIRARTGVLTETPALDSRLTARATLLHFAEVYGVPARDRRRRVDELLATFELQKRADSKVGGFSKGMRQRLALARTLIHDPDIIFLDEPTSGLDPVAIRDVHQMIEWLTHRGRTVFLCTHNLAEAERLCDRVAVLAQGRVLAIGTTRELGSRLNRGHRISVEVDASDIARAVKLFAATPPVSLAEAVTDRAAVRNGSASIVLHGVSRPDIPQIIQTATEQGIKLYRVQPEEPSLEDVYFALQEL
ncbi:MAG TPA: ABC transporter ATP-binding protein [Chloroflexi bacterium]|nr:ABC transporter ATP-binding protein [Chloroflexota bacterium]